MKAIFILLTSCTVLITSACSAEEVKPKAFEGIEFLSGFGWGNLRDKRDYHLMPVAIDFDFSIKPLLQKFNLNPKQLLQFQIEPFLSIVTQPKYNIETGTTFLFKIGLLPESSRFQPYLKCGLGMVYMTLHTREQASQFNFTEQGGLGFHYLFRKNAAFTLEGRMRHLSNADIKKPNKGINSYFILTGINYKF